MMASTFSAGAALLLVAMAAPQITTGQNGDDRVLQQIRAAAAQTAHADAQAYLEQERRTRKVAFASVSMDRPQAPRDVRFDPFSTR